MASQFPTTIVTTSNITDSIATNTLAVNNHTAKHNDLRDEIIAIETKVGANNSAVTTTHDYKLGEVITTDKAVGKTATQTLTNKTLTSPVVNVGSDATGDMYYRNAGGVLTRLPAGSTGQILTSNGTIPTYQAPNSTNTFYIQDTGVANAYVATLVPAITSYTAGLMVQFRATNANTGASTVNVNGLGVRSIFKLNGSTALVAGDIAAGQIVELEYDGTNFQMISPVANAPINPLFFGDGSDGDVTISSNTTLTRDMFYNNLTVNSTFTLSTANYRVFVKGTLTNNGTIANNGVAGGNGVTNSVNGVGAGAIITGTLLKAGDGGSGAGFTVNGACGGGGSGAGVLFIAAQTIAVEGFLNSIGGAGGNAAGTPGGGVQANGVVGGNVNTLITTGTGGNVGGGTVTVSKLNLKSPTALTQLFDTILVASLTGGAGGAGGAGTSSTMQPGGGGMGGLIVEIYTTLVTSGTKNVAGGAAGTGGTGGATAGSAGRAVSLQII